jgi:hypothetical protein
MEAPPKLDCTKLPNHILGDAVKTVFQFLMHLRAASPPEKKQEVEEMILKFDKGMPILVNLMDVIIPFMFAYSQKNETAMEGKEFLERVHLSSFVLCDIIQKETQKLLQ